MASTYHISKHSSSSYGSIVDRRANGGLEQADVCVLKRAGGKVSVTVIDDHFGYLVPKNVRWLISLSLSQLVCTPGHSDT